ncbi:uncharacterized protein BCR38DRAFT_408679 [Pseudomassariella vexata]|uniref:DHHA2 domain-containing protein n=1 Tax=Pseudomassariella vexata TaxID=1141098 RepID=A0A1Y2E058_9PEZI|nr:uncharacterized protein BCR38DRAFT_408679 [Pseudomassariella vexata]ORY64923.1 hypothetical protein BCR38DRAFT_408679 [Pseudomassariella vexata]
MPPRTSLQAFLATARAALTAPPSKRTAPVTFVVGNESADLDSLCSALLLAYLRTHTPPHALHVPLCNLPRDDLTLRPEFTSVLRSAAAHPSDILTLTELPHPEALKAEDTEWLLVDHNAMTGSLGELYGSRVVGCIDHHADESKVPRDSATRIIEKTGSCASLVTEHCRSAWDALSTDEQIDAQLAYLGLGPILVDTTNLTDKNKTTEHDVGAVEYLEYKLANMKSSDDGIYERSAFWTRISHLKEDIASLSLRDVFRKDYKEWDEGALKLGTSSAPQDFRFLVEKAGEGAEEALVETLGKWAEEKKVDLVAVLTAFRTEGVFQRELLVWGRTAAGIPAAREFERKFGKELELESWDDGKLDSDGDEGEGGWRRCWKQGQVKDGRKQIGPMLREVMNGAK